MELVDQRVVGRERGGEPPDRTVRLYDYERQDSCGLRILSAGEPTGNPEGSKEKAPSRSLIGQTIPIKLLPRLA